MHGFSSWLSGSMAGTSCCLAEQSVSFHSGGEAEQANSTKGEGARDQALTSRPRLTYTQQSMSTPIFSADQKANQVDPVS